MTNKKSILFLCYYFPPISSIAIWRNYYLALEAQKSFKEVHVFTTSNQRIFPKIELELYRFIITNLKTYDYRTFKNGSTSNLNYSEKSKSGFFAQLGIKLLNSFPISFIIGEGGIVYIYNGYKKGIKLIESGTITHIYSSYRTMADHFIAYFLKRKFRELHWTADFRDLPFDSLYKNYVFRSLQDWIIKRILQKADLVTTFSQGLANGLQKYTSKKIQLLLNGLFKSENTGCTRLKSDKFIIQYTGSLFLEERDPGTLFKVIKELIEDGNIEEQMIQISYAGKDGNKWESYLSHYKLQNIGINHGMLGAWEVQTLQNKATINLLLTSSHVGSPGTELEFAL